MILSVLGQWKQVRKERRRLGWLFKTMFYDQTKDTYNVCIKYQGDDGTSYRQEIVL